MCLTALTVFWAATINGLEEMDGTGSANRVVVHRFGRLAPNLLGVGFKMMADAMLAYGIL